MAITSKVVMLPSRMADQARSNPVSMDALRLRPARSSSRIRSKMMTLASTAMPTEMTKAAMPDSVRVISRNLKIAMTNTA